jgi:hypothetical protein
VRNRWLGLIRGSEDSDLGAAITRMARRAAEVHVREAFEAGGVTIAERLELLGEGAGAFVPDSNHPRLKA